MIHNVMLACSEAPLLSKLRYPYLVTPKIDGIRCIVQDGKALTRRLKPVPNTYIRLWIEEHCPNGFDGEIVCPGGFNMTQRFVMRRSGTPPFAFRVFDYVFGRNTPYETRVADLRQWIEVRGGGGPINPVYPDLVENEEDLLAAEAVALEEKYEGLILRSPDSPYKWGRSTLRENYMLKLKRFLDSEAFIVDVEELQHNENEQTESETGHLIRSASQVGLRPGDTLGALWVRDRVHPDWYFKIGSGFTDAQRAELWQRRESLPGMLVVYKYQPYGMKNVPRIPVFKGLRSPLDLIPINENAE